MRGGARWILLERKTPQAFRVASPADGQGRLPPPQKEILCRKTVIVGRTGEKVLQERALPMLFLVASDGRNKFSVIVMARIPLVVVFNSEACSPVMTFPEADGRVGPHGKEILLWTVIHGRKMGSHNAGLQERCDTVTSFRYPVHLYLRDRPVLARLRIKSHRRAIRDEEQLAEFRHGDEIFFFHRDRSVPGKSGHSEVRMLKYPAPAVRIEHKGKIWWAVLFPFHCLPV